MKKVLFAAFAGVCVLSSVMATSANGGKMYSRTVSNQLVRDTIPSKKTDTSSYPKKDTASMPRLDQNQK